MDSDEDLRLVFNDLNVYILKYLNFQMYGDDCAV